MPLASVAGAEAAPGRTRGSLAISFDAVGLVAQAPLKGVNAAFAACASPKLARLAHPEAFELTFMWPFVIER